MADCILPPPAENQALGPRQSLYSSFSLALALRGGAIMRAPTKLRVMVRWLSMDRRHSPDGADQIREHISYPLIQSLEAAGDSCLFFVPGLPDARQGDGVCRLSDVQENPWILKAGTETFPGPCELTNERTQTWIVRLKITTKLVGLTKQQLHEQNWEQCFSEMLTVFDALVDVLFNIQGLRFSRSDEVAGIVNKMVNAFKGVIERTSNEIRRSKESTIHPATFVVIQVLEFFHRNREMVKSILESGDYNTGPCSDMVNCLIPKLKEYADTNFQETGRRYIFILNNIYYVKNCPLGLLPPSVVSNLVLLADQNIVSYLHEYWFPPMLSYLDGDSLMKPRRSSMDKFMEIFFNICDSQMTWKVQTTLKEKLREEIVKLVVPKYVKFLEALQESRSSHSSTWIKRMRRARSEKPMYTPAQLERVIRGLFER
uniref:Uncharacterized protein n=1 Tax=Avena sativa TaxID=4498 RepID=A0ACD5YAC0_AVESA